MVKLGCVFCSKGKPCPIHSSETYFKLKNLNEVSDFYSASPPSVFIGSKLKYPNVNVGILSPVEENSENAWLYDAQRYWSEQNFSIMQIVNFRKSLVNSRFKSNVYSVRNNNEKFLELAQEIGMANNSVDVEIELRKKIKFNINFNKIALPNGPIGDLKKIKITGNPKISERVEKVVNDDLKAVEAINYLYNKGFDEKILSQLLSIGVLGLKKNRKLVPTRFSITATDDSLAKILLKQIKNFNLIENYSLYFGGYLGNYYLVLMFPDNFSYELFESYLPSSIFSFKDVVIKPSTDFEGYYGRKNYADSTAGGYYAARLGIVEKLHNIKRQASVLVLRFITDEYKMPLGVFVCRESVRKSLSNKVIEFNSMEEMLKEATRLVYSKFKFDINSVLKQSKLLKQIKTQKKLSSFL